MTRPRGCDGLNIRRLVREARESATLRGHRMAPFRHERQYIGDLAGIYPRFRITAASTCRDCGRGAYCDTRPAPNSIDVHGEAVALNCTAHD